MKHIKTKVATSTFSSADIDKRIALSSKGERVAAVLKALINDYSKYQGPHKGTEALRQRFCKDVFAVLGDAPALKGANIVNLLKLQQYDEPVVIEAANLLQKTIKSIDTVRTPQFAQAVNRFVNSLWLLVK